MCRATHQQEPYGALRTCKGHKADGSPCTRDFRTDPAKPHTLAGFCYQHASQAKQQVQAKKEQGQKQPQQQEATICKGVKKDGSPCTRTTKSFTGYCQDHRQASFSKPAKQKQPQAAAPCKAVQKDGKPCLDEAKERGHCGKHKASQPAPQPVAGGPADNTRGKSRVRQSAVRQLRDMERVTNAVGSGTKGAITCSKLTCAKQHWQDCMSAHGCQTAWPAKCCAYNCEGKAVLGGHVIAQRDCLRVNIVPVCSQHNQQCQTFAVKPGTFSAQDPTISDAGHKAIVARIHEAAAVCHGHRRRKNT